MTARPDLAKESFARRAARAEALVPAAPAAAEPLRFAAVLYRAQAAMAAGLDGRALAGRLDADLPALAGGMERILADIAAHGPPALAAAARARTTDAGLAAFWRGGRSGRSDYLARAQLRPWVEVLAERGVAPEPFSGGGPEMTARCDFCGGLAWVGARRPIPGGDGNQRVLGCALCGREREVGRIVCPVCGEGNPDALPNFQSDRHPAARVEACATCHSYLKSIDLSIDARAVPEVDDLASIALDLWAAEEGYTRIEPGLAGL